MIINSDLQYSPVSVIHKECGKTMKNYEIIKNGKRIFKCPNCNYENNKTITVLPDFNSMNDKINHNISHVSKLKQNYLTQYACNEFKNYLAENELNQALKNFNKQQFLLTIKGCINALKMCDKESDVNKKIENLLLNAYAKNIENFKQGINLLENSLELCSDNTNMKNIYKQLITTHFMDIIETRSQLMIYYFEKGRDSEVKECYKQIKQDFDSAFNIYNTDTDKKQCFVIAIHLAQIFQKLAGIYYQKKNFLKAAKYYQKEIILNEAIIKKGDVKEGLDEISIRLRHSYLIIFDTYIALSNQYGDQKDYTKAKKMLNNCEKYEEKIKLGSTAFFNVLKNQLNRSFNLINIQQFTKKVRDQKK